ncbi:MAG TPA: zf-HC2 domain-containing protein [Burkholderiales bacterium]|nr:zf-HC2 domain-containing protein [Burkholderiales bacterium]
MNCARLRQVLDAHLDGELDHATGEEIERHAGSCAACAAFRAERNALRERVRAQAPYYRAPAALKRSVGQSLAAASEPAAVKPRPTWLQAALLAAVAALISATAGYWIGRPLPDGSLSEQVVASHVASLAGAGRLTEVGSTDRHAVKPWFQGKVDFTPVVRDLSGEGYILLGARLDHVADRQATAVVYRVRNHIINLFAWRAVQPGDEPTALARARGFNIAAWSEGGLRFAAVSDVDAPDLARFAELVRQSP